MRALLALVPFSVFAVASCGSSEAPTPPPSDTSTTAGGGPGKTCRPTCSAASDCATEGVPLQDAAHFECRAGRCEWLGCQSDAECTSALQSQKVACATEPGATTPSCVATCQAASDCAVQGNPLGDASHFSCDAGHCRWLGCKSTADCTNALHSSRYACAKPEGSDTPFCLPTCTKASDCSIPGSKLNDASHYACETGVCKWLGCKTSAECSADLHTNKVVCE